MNEESGLSKLQPYQNPKFQPRSYIKDADLQIQVSHSNEAIYAQNIEAFKNIYAHYTKQITKAVKTPTENPAVQEVENEMEEAKETYNLMMDISNSISEAYQDLKNLK